MVIEGGFYAVKTHKNSFLILLNQFLFCNSFLLFVRYLHVDKKTFFRQEVFLMTDLELIKTQKNYTLSGRVFKI